MFRNLENVAAEVVRLLREGGHRDAAQDVEELVERFRVSTPEERPGLADALIDRCQPRWLGDLNVHTASWEEWVRLLTELAKHAKKQVEKNAEKKRGRRLRFPKKRKRDTHNS